MYQDLNYYYFVPVKKQTRVEPQQKQEQNPYESFFVSFN